MKGAVGVAGIAEIFLFLALLQDDDALAELRGAIGGDQARDAGPDHDHVVLDVRFGHRIRSPISIVAMLPLPLIGHHVSCRGQRCFDLPPPSQTTAARWDISAQSARAGRVIQSYPL